jgi:LAGLIDADG DNA endonuclease family protein
LNTDEPQCGDVLLKILLIAGTSSTFGIIYGLFLIILTISVKIIMTWGQSAGVRSISTSEASQRLHAGDLIYAYLVGLFEGDGFFTITKKGKYLTYELGIELSIRDVQLIYKIKNLLGVGTVSFRKIGQIERVSLRIRDKNHLKYLILPIFDKYPMFSNKQHDYLRFRDTLLSGIIYSADLPKYSRPKTNLNDITSIIKAFYFSA